MPTPTTSTVFSATTIEAKFLSNARIRGYLLTELQRTAKDAKDRLEEIVSTWEHDVPFTEPRIRFAGGDAHIKITTEDVAFFNLDRGTHIRWAVMSNPFMPKTIPGGPYKSGPGVGGSVIRGRRYMQAKGIPARPGIEARKWTERLGRDIQIIIKFRIDEAIRLGSTPR